MYYVLDSYCIHLRANSRVFKETSICKVSKGNIFFMYYDSLLYVPTGSKASAAFIPGIVNSWFESKSWNLCIIFLFLCVLHCKWKSISCGFRTNACRKYYTGKTEGSMAQYTCLVYCSWSVHAKRMIKWSSSYAWTRILSDWYYIRGVTGGTDQNSGGCSLCYTIPI